MISQLARALQYADNHPSHTSEAAKLSIMQAIFVLVTREFGFDAAQRLLKPWG